MTVYTSEVKECNDGTGDLYIDLPVPLFNDLGWDENTPLEWVITEDGRVVLRKLESTE